MQNKYCLFIVLSIGYLLSFGQEYDTKIGTVSMDEITMQYCPIDSSAKAFYIHDFGSTVFVNNDSRIEYMYERKSRIKILDKSALDLANIEITLYKGSQPEDELSDLEAYSYNLENGKIVKTSLEKSNIFDYEINDSWKSKKFAVPNVKPGSVIEISYKIRSAYCVLLKPWYFQHSYPVLYSDFEIHINPIFEYTVLIDKQIKFDIDTSYTLTNNFRFLGVNYPVQVYQWAINNVSAFEDESFITTRDDYIKKVEFQLSKYIEYNGAVHHLLQTWDDLIKRYLKAETFGQYIQSTKSAAKNEFEALKIDSLESVDKIRIITDFVKSSYKFDNHYGEFANQTKNKLLKSKTGNAAAINLYLLSFLRAAGFEAYPVILSTRDHGKIFYDYPFSIFFNYVIVVVNTTDGDYFLDATDPLLAFNQIPSYCLNGYGLRMKKDEVLWYKLSEQSKTSTKSLLNIKFNENATECNGSYMESSKGYIAHNFRDEYIENGEEDLIQEILRGNQDISTKSIAVENTYETSAPFKTKIECELQFDKVDNKIFLPVLFFNKVDDNPFQYEERDYPVDFKNAFSKKNIVLINIPEGYAVAEFPKSVEFQNEDKSLKYKLTVENHPLNLQVMSELNIGKQSFSVEEYKELKAFFQSIVDKHKELIILEKLQ